MGEIYKVIEGQAGNKAGNVREAVRLAEGNAVKVPEEALKMHVTGGKAEVDEDE